MAAIYLHNAVYSRTPQETRETEHSRNLSTISSVTLHTSTTLHSQPTEPLLQPPLPSETAAYYDQVNDQPRNPDGSPTQLRWDDQPTPNSAVGEKGRTSDQRSSQPWKKRRRGKLAFEIVISAWAVYNTVRYFMAFVIYGREASTGQIFCLALGISTGLSFALTFCSFVLSAIRYNLLTHSQAYKYLTRICPTMNYLSSILLLAPAVANFVLLFTWRNSPNSRYNLQQRCHLDIDNVWSASVNPCTNKSPSWSLLVILSTLRLFFTSLILVAYHTFTFLYPDSQQSPLHHRLRSASETFSPAGGNHSSLAMMARHNQDLRAQHHTSDVSLDDATLRGDISPPFTPSRIHLMRSRSSGFSGETAHGEPLSFGRITLPDSEGDRDQNYTDRFRSLLAQITQETEEALEYARHDQPSSLENDIEITPASLPPSYSQGDYDDDEYDDHDSQIQVDHDNVFNLPPIPPSLGYNEFGLPYPPDQDVRMLNGYIRRMPTIESMGSGEVGSSMGASSARPGGSIYTSSRPPTRNTLLSFSSVDYEAGGSNPPSRANSLSARAELLAGLAASEHGELLVRPEVTIRRLSSPNSFVESPLASPTTDTYSSGTSGSRATSYHTATVGSSGESYMPASHLDTTPRPSHTREHQS
ncbi:hypothetical protein GALMADRAFT_245399 [Galerina marginata CBS 339.88]|uniref:Uncharacterized protein n=1 Tax=Galerina marginata (strain CBS 339.88) TaxID=685588 RepID=A0A067T525_GALM3|nr:hypothetical protein GALMADRAFT_245399 [Galerina marginata CBS 339.88]